MMNAKSISIDALFASDGINPNRESAPRQTLAEAEVILAHDVMTDWQAVVFGRNLLQQIIQSGVGRVCRVLHIELDVETDELEKLLALLIVVKGRHEYAP